MTKSRATNGNKKVFLLCAASLLFVTSALPCSASTAQPGTISNIMVTPEGIVLFNHSGARTALPACQNTTIPTRWAFNGATAAGQAKLAILMSAYGLNKTITLQGTGTCSDWGDTESITYMIIQS